MKIVALICRILIGLIFTVFGLNGFFQFMKGPIPCGLAGQFLGALMQSHYVWVVAGVQVLSGLLFLCGRYLTLALVLSAGLLVNINTFHATMLPQGWGMGLGCTLFWILIAMYHRDRLAPIFRP